VGDGDDRLLVSAMPQDAAIPGGHRAVLSSGRPESSLDECPAQPDVAFAGLPGFVLAGTLVIPRGTGRPSWRDGGRSGTDSCRHRSRLRGLPLYVD
jgi:hypothetical protein